jgi:Protein of unknown function (DUF4197)
MSLILSRRRILASFGIASAALLSGVAKAGLLDSLGLGKLLGNASDNALDKLGATDGFYRDTAVRIALPGATGKLASKALRFGDKLGLTTKLTKSLNDAASMAALEAKPIFRSAISQIKLSDIPGLATQKDGAAQYLLRTAGPDLHLKVKPLIASALTKVGAYQQLANINKSGSLLGSLGGSLGLSDEKLTESVSQQAMKGIFSYIGQEEAKLRANPLGVL